jgi:hypothetical protein
MSEYQIARIEVEVFEQNAVLSGQHNVAAHKCFDPSSGCGWITSPGDTVESSLEASVDKVVFKKRMHFIRIKALGLEYDGIYDGDMDFAMKVTPFFQLLTPGSYSKIMAITQGLQGTKTSLRSSLVFAGVFAPVKEGEKVSYDLRGILPLDKELEKIMITNQVWGFNVTASPDALEV